LVVPYKHRNKKVVPYSNALVLRLILSVRFNLMPFRPIKQIGEH